MILDLMIISISIKINDDPPQPLNARFSSQKNSKYRGVAEQNGFEFMPFVFSHNGQIHPETVSFICRQIEAKLMLVDGKVSKSKKESIWKLWVLHYLSVAINKTASRNVLRKVTKMINDSNSDQRQASSSSFCEEVFPLSRTTLQTSLMTST